MTDRIDTFTERGIGLESGRELEADITVTATGLNLLAFGEESERPYNRPPLSKDYLQDKSEKDKIYVHPQGWYAEHDIDLRRGTRVTGLDVAAWIRRHGS